MSHTHLSQEPTIGFSESLPDQNPVVHQENTNELQERIRHIIYKWFVRYNPLYFFSALCVLFGMFLVSQGLGVMEWTSGQLFLTRVFQVYEFLLIGAAALLFRKAGQDRPAVILGLIEMVLLFDCTFRSEVATTLEHSGRMTALVLGLLVALKLIGLVWTFRLKVSPSAIAVPVLAAIGLVGFPQLIHEHQQMKDLLHLLATWYGIGLTAFVYLKRPTISCQLFLDEWGQTVLRRAIKAAWIIWAGWYFFHLFVWLDLFGISFSLVHLTSLLLLLTLVAFQTQAVWAGSILTLVISFADPSVVSYTACAVGLVLGWKAWQLKQKHLLVGTVLAGYLAFWTFGWQHWPLPDVNLWLNLTTAAVLILMAWRLRLPFALLPLVAGLYPALQGVRALNVVGKGMMFLALGFVALIAGVAFNWSQRKKTMT